jgi:hypothetical protein
MALDRAVLVDDDAVRVGRIGARGDIGEEAAVDVDRRERLEADGLMVDRGWLSLRLGNEGLCGRAAAGLAMMTFDGGVSDGGVNKSRPTPTHSHPCLSVSCL